MISSRLRLVIASEAKQSIGTYGALRPLDRFVASLLAKTAAFNPVPCRILMVSTSRASGCAAAGETREQRPFSPAHPEANLLSLFDFIMPKAAAVCKAPVPSRQLPPRPSEGRRLPCRGRKRWRHAHLRFRSAEGRRRHRGAAIARPSEHPRRLAQDRRAGETIRPATRSGSRTRPDGSSFSPASPPCAAMRVWR